MKITKHLIAYVLIALSLLIVINIQEVKALTDEQKIIQEVADAYYSKTRKTNYYRNKRDFRKSPEEITSQDFAYLDCASFVYNVYYEAFGIDVMNGPTLQGTYARIYRNGHPNGDNDIIYYVNNTSLEPTTVKKTKDEIFNMLEVGDIIGYDDEGKTGHVMLVYDLIKDENNNTTGVVIYHDTSLTSATTTSCANNSYDCQTVKTKIGGLNFYLSINSTDSNNPAAYQGSVMKIINTNGSYFSSHDQAWVYRPLLKDNNGNYINKYFNQSCSYSSSSLANQNSLTCSNVDSNDNPVEYTIKSSSLTRLAYPKLYIEKTVNVENGNIVQKGDELEYTIKLKNNSDSAYSSAISVVENVSDYVTVNNNSITDDGILSNKKITWNINLEAGQEKNVKYKVTVNDTTDAPAYNKTVESTGKVGNIENKTITNKIGHNFSSTEANNIKAKYDELKNTYSGYELINQIYDELFGIDLGLDSDQFLLGAQYHRYRLKGSISVAHDVKPSGITSVNYPKWLAFDEAKNPYYRDYDEDRCYDGTTGGFNCTDDKKEIKPLVITRPDNGAPESNYSLWLNTRNDLSSYVLSNYYNGIHVSYTYDSSISDYSLEGSNKRNFSSKWFTEVVLDGSVKKNNKKKAAHYINHNLLKNGDILLYSNRNDSTNISSNKYNFGIANENGDYAFVYYNGTFYGMHEDGNNEITITSGDQSSLNEYTYNTKIENGEYVYDETMGDYIDNNLQLLFAKDYYAIVRPSMAINNIESISLEPAPTKLTYVQNYDNLDLTGGKLLVKYNYGQEIIDLDDQDVEITGFSNATVGAKTLTVSYGGATTTFDVEIVSKQATSIEMKTNPTKMIYVQNSEELDLTGGKITVRYNDNTATDIALTNSSVEVTGFSNATVGQKTLTVTYNGLTTTFKVNVVAKEVESIAMKTNPIKTSYIQGSEELDLTGGIIEATYNDDTKVDVALTNSGVEVTGFSNEAVGQKTLTVTYYEKTTTFKVEIIEKEVVGIEIISEPSKTTYVQNSEELDLSGGIIEITYNDGTKSRIAMTSSNIEVIGYDNSKVGQNTISIGYGGKAFTYDLEIISKQVVSVEIAENPSRVSYSASLDSLVVTGGILKITYNDGTIDMVNMTNEKVSITGYDKTSIGKQKVTVEYLGRKIETEVMVVKEAEIENPSTGKIIPIVSVLTLTGVGGYFLYTSRKKKLLNI